MKHRAAAGFFIAGTGTGVGKTYASRILAETFSKRMPVSYMKPVQTGCVLKKDGGISAPDFDYVKKSGVVVTGNDGLHVPYRFVPACSPHLAARMAHEKISLKKIRSNLHGIVRLFGASASHGCVLVEGAGGLLTPMNESTSMIHLVDLLGLPVVLVTTPALGTLNQTFLALCALESIGAGIAGVIMNSPRKISEDYIYKDNMAAIRSSIRPAPFLEIKHKAVHQKKTMEFCNELAARYL